MKRILLGICGIGNGHLNRQKSIIKKLLEYDIELILAVTTNNFEFCKKMYPNVRIIKIDIPWIVCNKAGVNFEETLKIYKDNSINQFESFLTFAIEVEKIGKPDLVISDYEPNVAQYAYAINKPLICLEQQSKFLYLHRSYYDKDNDINEEISRLNYFFPKVNTRFISSFFQMDFASSDEVITLPPILRKIKRGKINENKAVVYFSPYTNDISEFILILKLLAEYPHINFYIYSNFEFLNYEKYKHMIFKKIGEDFDNDLYDCSFIISTSGHQLISEAINLQIPLYIFPLKTFEQKFNCDQVEKLGFGKKIKEFTKEEFNLFYQNLDKYRKNMKNYKKYYWKEEWDKIFFKELENKYNIKKLNKN